MNENSSFDGSSASGLFSSPFRSEDGGYYSSSSMPLFSSSSSSSSMPLFSSSSSPQAESMNDSDWGIDHPDGHDGLKTRAVWTDSELLYVYNFSISGNLRRTPNQCLIEIGMDASARRIFHPNHVIGKGRIAHAFSEIRKPEVVKRILRFRDQETL